MKIFIRIVLLVVCYLSVLFGFSIGMLFALGIFTNIPDPFLAVFLPIFFGLINLLIAAYPGLGDS